MALNVSTTFIGAVKDDWRMFSDCPDDYTIGAPIGFGASSVVYAAIYRPPHPEQPHPYPCALKVLDLDSLAPHSLSLLQRETQLMSLSKHPNVLRVRGSWVGGHHLNIALRLMNKGSAADVMRYAWPGGMEEEVVKCILKQALEGLNYLHVNGFIHRDVKAANLLIDDDGTVLVGDLGVAAPLTDDSELPLIHPNPNSPSISNLKFDGLLPQKASNNTVTPSRPHTGRRKSFVGTPCWMAPELIQGKRYDAKADIWSFGITAIELTQGRPPRSRESAHTVLVQTVQGKAPTLDCERGVHRYSRAFKEMVDACLAKDPSKRPSAAELLQTPFLKSAKKKSYLVGAILDGLPPLTIRQERVRRQESLLSHRTMDSWDFSSPTGSRAPSLVGSNHKMKSSKPATFPLEPENRDESMAEPCHSDNAKPPRSPPAHISLGLERDDVFFNSPLSPVPPSPNTSSESFSSPESLPKAALHNMEPTATSPPNSVLSRPPPTSPIPIPLHTSARRPSSSQSSPMVPSSSSSPSSQSFWNRLTRKPSRTELGDQESPRGDKGNTISRFLGRRRSSTLAQRPILTPS